MFHYFSPSSHKTPPLFSVGRFPVSMVTLLIGIHIFSMVLTTLFMSIGHGPWVNALCFNSTALWHGQLSRLITYAFVNPPSIWFILEMMMLFYFGSAIERAIGPSKFALLYGGLILLGALLLQFLNFYGAPGRMSGSQSIDFAIFAAFIAMYPRLPFFFGIPAQWVLFTFVTLSLLQFLEAKQFAAMALFFTESLGAILFMASLGYRDLFPRETFSFLNRFLHQLSFFSKVKKETPSTHSAAASVIESCSTTTSFVPVFTTQPIPPKKAAPSTEAVMLHIDTLLEKISQTGMQSLTPQEKEQLEKASTALLERDRATKPLRTASR